MPEQTVLALSHSAALGGGERVLVELLEALLQTESIRRAHVIIPADGALRPLLESRGIGTTIAPVAWWVGADPDPVIAARRAGGIVRSMRHVGRTLDEFRPTLTLTSTLASPVLAFASVRRRTRHVWLIQEFMDLDHDLSYLYGLRKSLQAVRRTSHRVLALSEALSSRAALFGIPAHVVQPSMSLFTPSATGAGPAPPIRALLAGSIQPGKGQLDAVQAVTLARGAGVDLELTVVGTVTDRRYCDRIVEIATETGLVAARAFHLRAPTSDLAEFIAQHHVVVVCSRAEGFGRITAEGQIASRAVVAADAGASRELIQDGVTGLLYEAGRPESLAMALTSLADPVRRETLGSSASQSAHARFSPQRSAGAFAAALGWPTG